MLNLSSIRRMLLRHWPIILPYALFCFVVRDWFRPGLILGEDQQTLLWANLDNLRHSLPWPQAWDPTYSFGTSQQLHMNMAPILFLGSLLAAFGCTWPVFERLLLLYPLTIFIVLGPYLFLYRISRSSYAAAMGATVCALNTWTVGLIERGHIPSLMAASLIPLVLLQASEMNARSSMRRAALLALTITVQVAYDIRYAYLAVVSALLLVLIRTLMKVRRPMQVVASAGTIGRCILWLGVLNLYWIVPSIVVSPTLPSGYTTTDGFVAGSHEEDLVHSFTTLYPFYHHILSSNPFERAPSEWGFAVLTLFALVGFSFASRRPIVRFCVLLWVISVIFISGPLSVFGALNLQFFAHVPGANMFRDVTKVISLSSLMIGCGVALAIMWLPRLSAASKRFRFLGKPQLIAGLFFALYVVLMSDSLNPLRFSNFRTYTLTESDRRLASFVSQKAQPGAILFFPAVPIWETSTPEHRMIPGSEIATLPFPVGIVPYADDPADILSTYRSPLLPSLLCQLGVRYVMLQPDPYSNIYEPWQYGIERGETFDFFRSQPWLKPIDIGEGQLGAESRYVAFSLQSCKQTSTLAFIAPRPVGFNGSSSALDALAGTPWWSERSAVVLGSQSTPRIFQRLGNIINAPYWSSKNRLEFSSDDQDRDSLNHAVSQVSLFRRHDYVGFAFNPNTPSPVGSAFSSPGTGKAWFTDSAGGRADVHALLVPNTADLGILSEHRVSALAPALRSSKPSETLFRTADFEAFVDSAVTSGVFGSPHPWIHPTDVPLTIALSNPLPVSVTADVEFSAAADAFPTGEVITATLNDTQRRTWVPPLIPFGFSNLERRVILRELTLTPGVSSLILQVESRDGRATKPFFVAPEVAITNVSLGSVPERVEALPTSIRRSQTGLRLVTNPPKSFVGLALSRWRLQDHIGISLTRRPHITMRYLAPASPVAYRMIFGISYQGNTAEYPVVLAPTSSIETIDLFDHVREALNDRLIAERRAHALDYAWLFRSFQEPELQASDYRLEYIDFQVSEPGDTGVQGRPGELDALRIEIARGALGGLIRNDLTQAMGSTILAPRNVHATNLEIVKIERRSRDLNFVLSLPASNQEASPSELHAGDSVSLQLVNGDRITGSIREETPSLLVIDQPDGELAVNRSSILTMQGRISKVQKALSFEIPISMPTESERLDFDLHTEHNLKSEFILHVLDRNSGKTYRVVPRDRLAGLDNSHDLPPTWLSIIARADEISAAPIGLPVARSAPPSSIASWTHYQLDLPAIFASEVPGVNDPEVTSIEFHLSVLPSNQLSARLSTEVNLADLSFVDWEDPFGSMRAETSVGLPELMIDGGSAKLQNFVPSASDGFADFASARIRTNPGFHVIEIRSGADRHIQAALVGHGRPKTYDSAVVTNVARPSQSEVLGRLQTSGGLLAYMQTYSSGWAVALLPDGVHANGELVHDFLISARYFVDMNDHVILNGFLNGWFIPAHHGTIVFLFLPSLYERLGIVLEAAAILALIVLSRRITHARAR
ncbi:MAG TPA: hypothetical protein VGZ00_13365 [Candidatus Baltobacteraceae bacterium]|nr:hypothetical protein [Candidatus Baltobacteraceae bacterium]